ncbi:MAG: hypothetical protein JWP11_846 [Frankiales bacterium]|nr:hypothetical protein [Frankiales bacterium]
MTDPLVTLMRDGAREIASHGAMPPAAAVFREGRRRHRRRSAALGAAGAFAAAATAFVITGLPGGGGSANGQLGTDGGSTLSAGSGAATITVVTASTAPSYVAERLRECARLAAAAAQAARGSHEFRYQTSSAAATVTMYGCASRQDGVAHVSAVGEHGRPVLLHFTYADLPQAVPGSLRDTGIAGSQTWLEASRPGAGTVPCWGQPDPFQHVCAGSIVTPDGVEHLDPVLGPPCEEPRCSLIGGVVATNAKAGTVDARGVRLAAAVEHYDQFPGYAVVVAQWTGKHVTGGEFGDIRFVPAD